MNYQERKHYIKKQTEEKSDADIVIPVLKDNYIKNLNISATILEGHILVTGSTGTGKSTLLFNFTKNLRDKYPDADFIFLDPKEDFLSLYRPGDKICSFYKKKSLHNEDYFVWNLVDECLESEEPEDCLKEIVKNLMAEQLKARDANSFFPRAAAQILEGYLTTILRRVNDGIVPTHEDIYMHLSSMSLDKLRKRLSLEKDMNGIQYNIAETGGKLSNQAAGVMAELYQFINDFFVGNFKGRGHDTINKFLNEEGGKALFLEYDFSRKESSSIIFKTILDLLIQTKLSNSSNKNKKTFFILDEFSIVGDYSISEALNIGRAKGIRILAGLQSVEQVFSICKDEHTGNSILGGFSSIIAFRPNDQKTIDFIQDRVGTDEVTDISFALSRFEPPHISTNIRPLISSVELNNLDIGNAVVKLRNNEHETVKFINKEKIHE